MLRRRGLQAIQALLELALEPQRWHSVRELAELQNLPAPMLEQLLLRLRRAGLLEARRGRLGGYRLALPPPQIALNQVLAAVAAMPGPLASPGLFMPSHPSSDPANPPARCRNRRRSCSTNFRSSSWAKRDGGWRSGQPTGDPTAGLSPAAGNGAGALPAQSGRPAVGSAQRPSRPWCRWGPNPGLRPGHPTNLSPDLAWD